MNDYETSEGGRRGPEKQSQACGKREREKEGGRERHPSWGEREKEREREGTSASCAPVGASAGP